MPETNNHNARRFGDRVRGRTVGNEFEEKRDIGKPRTLATRHREHRRGLLIHEIVIRIETMTTAPRWRKLNSRCFPVERRALKFVKASHPPIAIRLLFFVIFRYARRYRRAGAIT